MAVALISEGKPSRAIVGRIPDSLSVVDRGGLLGDVTERIFTLLAADMEIVGLPEPVSAEGYAQPDIDRAEYEIFVLDPHAYPYRREKTVAEQIHVVADQAQIGESVHRETEFVNLPRRENDGFRGSDQAMTAVDILSQSAQARLVDEADALAEPVEPVPASGVIEIQELPDLVAPCSQQIGEIVDIGDQGRAVELPVPRVDVAAQFDAPAHVAERGEVTRAEISPDVPPVSEFAPCVAAGQREPESVGDILVDAVAVDQIGRTESLAVQSDAQQNRPLVVKVRVQRVGDIRSLGKPQVVVAARKKKLLFSPRI